MAFVLAGCGTDEPAFGGKTLPARADPSPGVFDESQIRGYHYFNEPEGQRREVHFVATGPRSTWVRQAEQCVKHHRDDGVEAPFCYAYASEAGFKATRFVAQNGQVGPVCWQATSYRALDGTGDSSRWDPDAVGDEGCPKP